MCKPHRRSRAASGMLLLQAALSLFPFPFQGKLIPVLGLSAELISLVLWLAMGIWHSWLSC